MCGIQHRYVVNTFKCAKLIRTPLPASLRALCECCGRDLATRVSDVLPDDKESILSPEEHEIFQWLRTEEKLTMSDVAIAMLALNKGVIVVLNPNHNEPDGVHVALNADPKPEPLDEIVIDRSRTPASDEDDLSTFERELEKLSTTDTDTDTVKPADDQITACAGP